MSIEAAAQRDGVHYSSSARHSARIPDQTASAKRGWLKRFGGRSWSARNDEAQSELPWPQQSCILQARIDPSLSIEAYCRSQEAKGIQARLRGDDYDNIYRG